MLPAARSVCCCSRAELDATALTVISPLELLTAAVQPEVDVDKPNVAAVVPPVTKVNEVVALILYKNN